MSNPQYPQQPGGDPYGGQQPRQQSYPGGPPQQPGQYPGAPQYPAGPQYPGGPQGPAAPQYPGPQQPAGPQSPGDWNPTVQRPMPQPSAAPMPQAPMPQAPMPQTPMPQAPVPQPGYGQQPPVHAVGGGPGPTPPKKHSQTLIIGLIVLGIVVAAGIGALIATMGGSKNDPGAEPSVTISHTSEPPSPSPSPSQTPTPSPTPTEEDTGGTITLDGLVITIPPGWKLNKHDESIHFAQIVDADGSAISLQVFPSEGKVSNVLVDEYLAQQMDKLTNPTKHRVKKLNIDPAIDVSEGSISGTLTTSSGSSTMAINTIMSVRGKDQKALMSTVVYNVRADLDKLSRDYNTVTDSGMRAQING
ncbi:hypothetical protein [Aestuariimicrobium sp. Y1814]|uniref:hypothetical protein n=1 Tax=Aestuariimicrobium sp. Y1814 TaxID=3418742 RepID=UPI003DA6E905